MMLDGDKLEQVSEFRYNRILLLALMCSSKTMEWNKKYKSKI